MIIRLFYRVLLAMYQVGIGFVTIVVTLCSMFAVNLVLAVIFDAYVSVVEGSAELSLKRTQSKAQRREHQRIEQERQMGKMPDSWQVRPALILAYFAFLSPSPPRAPLTLLAQPGCQHFLVSY